MRETSRPRALLVALCLFACSRAEPAPAGPPIFGGQGAKIAEPAEKPLPAESRAPESGPCAAGAPRSDVALIDDFEDGDHKIFKAFEREGWWSWGAVWGTGGCGGRFKLGRYVDLRDKGAKKEHGVPNNRVLVSICQAFGVDEPRFGHSANPDIVTGRLEELYG